MSRKRLGAVAAAVVVAAGGTGAAIAATSQDEAKQEEDQVLADAAKRLDTSPEKLRDALSAARDAQLDRAVKAGKLTQEQADAIKKHRSASGLVLGGGPGKRFGPGGPGGPGGPEFGHGKRGGFMFFGARRAIGEELAKALGTTPEKLREALRSGKSFADVAKASGKSLDDVKKALKAAARERLDKAVADKKLTRAQADKVLEHLDEGIDHLGERPRMRMRMRRGHGGPGFGPPRLDPDFGPPPLGPGAGPSAPAPPDPPKARPGALQVPSPGEAGGLPS